MKKLAFLFIFLPFVAFAQRVVVLSVTQPPEFGFSISRTDTTILKTTSVVLGTDLVVYGGSGDYQFLWSPAETLNDPTILNPMATPLDTTTYLLTVTDAFGCSFTLNYTVNTRGPLVGSDIIFSFRGLEAILFPNPSDGSFKVHLTGPVTERIELLIIDQGGRTMKSQTIRNFNGDHTEILNLDLAGGIYTLRIVAGSEMLSRQFIIH